VTDLAGQRPISLLIAALGGEGGGVLCNWIVAAIEHHGLVVQATSIPGVAQRTGATNYYIEAFPVPAAELGGRRPVLSLYPSVGDIDVMVASEMIEAGRAVQGGYVTPGRTILIASTHRAYAIGERAAMADGRFDSERVLDAANTQSKRAVLADFAALAKDNGTSLNAVLLGVVAASEVLPVPAESFEHAIRNQGIAVEPNLAGFRLGLGFAGRGAQAALPALPEKRHNPRAAGEVERRAQTAFPTGLHDVVTEAVRRLTEYQSLAYAARYLDRLEAIMDAERKAGGDLTLTRETGRWLALWMAYQDVIRVAQLKADPERHARVLDEIRAGADDPVTVTEFLKPGIDELCSILPPLLARAILLATARGDRRRSLNFGMHVKTTTINGFVRVWLLSKLRPWRPRTHRFREEQAAIETWLGHIARAAEIDLALAIEIAACADLIKGYGDTHERGMESYMRIVGEVVEPALSGDLAAGRAGDALANARAAALADPTGRRLAEVIEAIAGAPVPRAAE
jgi:indolepyruvate ferredoxin oxidoreductase beta subunit